MKDLSKSIRFLEVPVLVLVLLLIITFVGGKIIYDKFNSLNTESANLKSTQDILNKKLSILQTNNQTAGGLSSKVTQALPSQNPSFLVLGQLKNLVGPINMQITDVSVGQGAKVEQTGVHKVPISFKTEGEIQKILNTLLNVSKLSPLTKVEELKLISGAGENNYVATITLDTFWAELPAKIPAISEPVTELTPDENKVLQDLSQLSPLNLGSFQPVSTNSGTLRANPFSP